MLYEKKTNNVISIIILVCIILYMFTSLSFGQVVVNGKMRIKEGVQFKSRESLYLKSSASNMGMIQNDGELRMHDIIFESYCTKNDTRDGTLYNMNRTNVLARSVRVVKIFAEANIWYSVAFPFDVCAREISGIEDGVWIKYYDSRSRVITGDASGSWKNINLLYDTLKAGVGYMVKTSKSGMRLEFPNSSVSPLDIKREKKSVKLEYNFSKVCTMPDQWGWNFIGTCHTSIFDLKNGMIFKDGVGTRDVYIFSDGRWKVKTVLGIGSESIVVSPFIGFFVQIDDPSTKDGETSVDFCNEGKYLMDRICHSLTLDSKETFLMLSLQKEGDDVCTPDNLSIITAENFSEYFRNREDSPKLFDEENEVIFEFYTLTQESEGGGCKTIPVQVNRLNSASMKEGVRIGVKVKQIGTYKISISRQEGYNKGKIIYLRDNKNDSIHNLSKDSYAFTLLRKGEINNRFTLLVNDAFSSIPKANTTLQFPKVITYVENDNLYVKNIQASSEIFIYDVVGRLIADKVVVSEKEYCIHFPEKGIYIVKIVDSFGLSTSKVINE